VRADCCRNWWPHTEESSFNIYQSLCLTKLSTSSKTWFPEVRPFLEWLLKLAACSRTANLTNVCFGRGLSLRTRGIGRSTLFEKDDRFLGFIGFWDSLVFRIYCFLEFIVF
jgi:hypothetical protein